MCDISVRSGAGTERQQTAAVVTERLRADVDTASGREQHGGTRQPADTALHCRSVSVVTPTARTSVVFRTIIM